MSVDILDCFKGRKKAIFYDLVGFRGFIFFFLVVIGGVDNKYQRLKVEGGCGGVNFKIRNPGKPERFSKIIRPSSAISYDYWLNLNSLRKGWQLLDWVFL